MSKDARKKKSPWYIRTQTSHLAMPGHPDRKRRGEASEAEFVARAISLNLPVARYWGESDPADVLVARPASHNFWRVQVKCACVTRPGGEYEIPGGGHHLYTPDEIDFLAAHIVPANTWYIVPIHAFQGSPFLYLYPNKPRSRGRYEKYREAWCLLACDPASRGKNDIPTQCRCKDIPIRCSSCPDK